MIKLIVPGHVTPKARPRVTKKGTYMPKKYTECLEKIRLFAAQAMEGKEMLTGDLILDVINYRKGGGDWDNIGGTISDGLEGIVYKRDSQIVDGRVRKIRSKDERTEVTIRRSDG